MRPFRFTALQADIFTNLTRAAKENGHFKVYDRQNLPPQWHIHNDRRMGPILAVSDVDYAFHDMIATAKEYEKIYNIPSNSILSFQIDFICVVQRFFKASSIFLTFSEFILDFLEFSSNLLLFP